MHDSRIERKWLKALYDFFSGQSTFPSKRYTRAFTEEKKKQ
jgi:hypothetical protein